jgi:uncharacterized protein YcbX
MNDLELQDIYIYPIKSLGGLRLPEAEVQQRGLKYDRRWMLVDNEGGFLSQRKFSQMAVLQVSLNEDGLLITHKKNLLTPLLIPFKATTGKQLRVSIWDDTCVAEEVSADANEWFSDALQMQVRLVYMPETTKRLVETDFARNEEIVSFADAYPFMMIGQASLDDLNQRLDQPVLMNRFRPTFVLKGGIPYFEDAMHNFEIGAIKFKGVKPCARCVLTTVNQEEATKSSEPLKTLATYRTINNKVIFGQNLLTLGKGIVRVGDKIIVERDL